MLTVYFEKGLLVNLGTVKVNNSKAQLQSARDRIAKLNLGTSVVAKTKKNKVSVREQMEVANSKHSRNPISTQPRYEEEYKDHKSAREQIEQYMIKKPKKESLDYHATPEVKPKVTIKERFDPIQVRIDGQIFDSFQTPGVIPTGHLAGETTMLTAPNIFARLTSQKREDKKSTNITEIVDNQGNTHKVSLKQIEERLMKKCLGFTSSGKPCKKWAVTGHSSCTTHMTKDELKEYEESKSR